MFKNILGCIYQSMRKVCAAAQFNIAVLRCVLTRSLKMRHKLISRFTQQPLSHKTVICSHKLCNPPSFFAWQWPKDEFLSQNAITDLFGSAALLEARDHDL